MGGGGVRRSVTSRTRGERFVMCATMRAVQAATLRSTCSWSATSLIRGMRSRHITSHAREQNALGENHPCTCTLALALPPELKEAKRGRACGGLMDRSAEVEALR